MVGWTLLAPLTHIPTVATKELEASGGAYVVFNQVGQSVSWSNPVANVNAIVIRASIPDAPNGGGITATIDLYVDGVFRQAVTLSSKQSWNYRNSTTNPDDPNGGGMPWHFYNEDRAWIAGSPIAAGSTIKLQMDSGNTSSYYDIDCIDLENVPPLLTQPANSLSITAAPYNADPTFTNDSTVAIQNCINDARTQGKSVWIPQGKYMTNHLSGTALNLSGVAVHGAGMWYSMIYRNIPLPPPTTPWRSELQLGSSSTLTDVSIDSDAIYRGVGGLGGDSSGITAKGAGGWLIDHVWVQHCDAQWLSGTNGTIQNSRVADSWADGINLNNGNTPDPDKAGINLTAQNNFVRGGGDDGIAIFSDAGNSGTNPEMSGAKVLNNTSVAPYWANGLRIAGGKNVTVQNNLVTDPAANNGMEVSVFGNTGWPLDSATVSGNVILRGGGWNGTDRHGMHVGSPSSSNTYFPNAYTNATITGNTIQDSRRAGIAIGTTSENLAISSNSVDHPALKGIWIETGVTGTGSFTSNTVSNLNSGQAAFQNDSASTFITTLSNNSWQGSMQVSAPTFSPSGGTYNASQSVAISTITNGATIRYTTDSSVPTSTTGTVYSGAVSVSTTTTLKAIAYKSGLADSSVSSATYTISSALTDTDIGSPGQAGSASLNGSTYTVNGGGADIWGTSDQFNYDYKTDNGNGTITARVASVQNTNTSAKAGLMFRETTAASSAYVGIYVTPGSGIKMEYRASTGGTAASVAKLTGQTAPYWVRLVRSGNAFTGYTSPDGATWTQLGSISVAMATGATEGFAVCSHKTSSLCMATFDNVSLP